MTIMTLYMYMYNVVILVILVSPNFGYMLIIKA